MQLQLISRKPSLNIIMKQLLIPIMLWGTTDVLNATDYSLDLNGNSQYVDCGAGDLAITGASPRTIEAWIRCNTFNNAGALQMGQHGIHHGEFTLRTAPIDNHWVVQIWDDDFDITVTSKNIWTHFAITYDGTNIKAYVNGAFVSSYARDLNTVAANFYIGRWDYGFFDGQIDEVQIYNDVRTEAEIRKDMVDVNTSDANLLAYYKMTNGSGTVLTDNDGSGTAFPGTLVGGITWVTDVYDACPPGSGTSGTPYQIQNIRDLYWLSQHSAEWDKAYIQTANINAAATTSWGSGYNVGFSMIGTSSAGFTGSYDGNNHVVSNLYCKHNDPGYGVPGERVGFFGNISTATISNLGVTSVYVDGYKYVGGLVGQSNASTISNCYSTGTVKTSGNYSGISGGLIGNNISSTLNSSYSECTTSGIENYVGGLVGSNSSSNISNCYSSGSVTGQGSYCTYTGGLIGRSEGTSNVYQSYSTGNVNSADDMVGGLIGSNSAEINDCYSIGNVTASSGIAVGGLIGENYGTINNSYARGSATGSQQVGGLVGYNGSTINKSFSTGLVNNAYYSGGLVGLGSSGVSQSFWDTETSGQSSSASGTGKTTAQMNIRTTFSDAGWDFRDAGAEDLWNIGNNRNSGYPYLDWQYPADPVVSMASLTTSAISDISTTSASSGGNISSDGGGSVVARGVCWSTSTTPTISNDQTSDGTGTGSFSSSLSGLSTSTTYYVRAYATNPAGTAYGNQQQFTTWDALPAFSASPTSHAFGSLLVGETAQQTITVSNTGGGFLNITAVTPPAAAYAVSPSSASIAGSASQVFTLTFTPITAGDQNGNLAFSDNAGNHTVAITGVGLFQAQSDAGNMLTLNGINQYLEAELVSTATDNITMEAWVNWEGQSSGSAGIMYSGNSGADGYGIMLYDGVGRNLTILCGGVAFLTSSTALPTNSWHHVAAVRASGTWKLYLDGVERSITATTTAPNTPNGKLNIGSVTVGTSQFKGKLDEVRFWEVARSQAQIRSSYASLDGNEISLAAYYRLDEGTGISTGDGTGHEHTATLFNTPSWSSSSAPVSDPVFSATPSSHAFGNVLMGESAQQTITVTNSGGGILHISSTTTPGDDFAVSPTSTNIASGDDQEFTVTFAPTSTNAQSGSLAFTNNLGTSNVALSGTGVFASQADAEKALSFTGSSSQYLIISDPVNPTAYTVEMWVKPSGGVNQNLFVRTISTQSLSSYSQQLYINGDGYFTHYLWDGTVRQVIGSTLAQENTWYHVAITAINNGEMRLYVNGLEEGTAVALGAMQSTQDQYRIASPSHNGNLTYFTGEIDEVRLWDDVRTQVEIQTNYGSLAGNEAGLVGYWRLDEGSGASAGDGSGNNRTATLYNSPAWGNSAAAVVDPVYSASPASHDFGDLLIGEHASQNVTISNSGGGFINISAVAIPSAQYSVTPETATIGASSSQVFALTFEPTSAGADNGNLSFTENVGNNDVAINGTGVFQAQSAGENMLTFDGADDYLSCSTTNIPVGNSNYTIEAWIKPDVMGDRGIAGWGAYTVSNQVNAFRLSTTGLVNYWWGNDLAVTTGDLTGQWQHVAASFDGTTRKIYLNGSLIGSDTPSGHNVPDASNFTVGKSYAGEFFDGQMDEVRIWTLARTQAQIQASYGSLAGNETGLAGYWRLDETSGTTTGDGSGNENTLSFNSAAVRGSSTAPITNPVYAASASSLNLGNVLIGSNSQQTVTITNSGGGVLNIATAASDEGQFTVSPASADIVAGGNQVFTVIFTPSSRGSISGTLTFTHNPNGTTNTVGLAGVGQQVATVTTGAVSSIDQTTATGNGNITDLGYPNPTQHGVCWGTSENPTTADSKATDGTVSTTGAFTPSITGLTANTTYHVRAYAINDAGTAYGDDVSFTTLQAPTVTTQSVSSIDQTTATGNGNLTTLGNPAPTQHGVCWSTSADPTVSDSKTQEGSATATGAFTSSMTGLSPNTSYHVRAYAENSSGVVYGDDVNFTTLQSPTVTTQAVSSVSIETATGNGNITVLGNPAPTQHGVCWSTSQNPTTADNKTTEGTASSTGAFTSSITGLTAATTYYVRAYVTNSSGTVYGAEVSFSSTATEPTTQAADIAFSDPGQGQITIDWTNGNGSKRAVFLKESSSGSAEPVDRTSYTSNTAFGSGSQIDSTGWYCVYNGTGISVTVTGLTQTKTYRAMVCEYNGISGAENYLLSTATDNPVSYQLVYFVDQTAIGLPLLRDGNLDVGDYDSDGDLDLIFTGQNNSYTYFTKIMRNNGDGTFTEQTEMGLTGVAWSSTVEWGDYNADGYLDILLTGYSSGGFVTLIYRNNGDNSFTALSGLGLPGVGSGDARWGDYDSDGDLDFILTGNASGSNIAKIYRNEGSDQFVEQTNIELPGVNYSSVAWCDYDRDGFLDLLLTGSRGSSNNISILYHNTGNNNFEEASGITMTGVEYGDVAWGDYNDDGYADILLTGKAGSWGIAKVYTNNSGNSFTEETGITLEGVSYSSAAWGDYDNDGQLDIALTGEEYGYQLHTRLYLNNGDESFTRQDDINLIATKNGRTAWADYDGDQDLDLLVYGSYYSSGYHFTSKLYANIGASSNVAPTTPTNLQVAQGSGVSFSWDKASDQETTQNGLSYNLYVGTASTTGDILPSHADISNGYRRVVTIGNCGGSNAGQIMNLSGGTYHWGVQTVDNGYLGSNFVSGSSFTVLDQASNIVFTNAQATSVEISWTNGELDNRIIFMKETSEGMPAPVNNTSYTASATFGVGSQIGSSGWYCVYSGNGSSITVTDLSATATYRVMVCEYSGNSGEEDYLITMANDNPVNTSMPRFVHVVDLMVSTTFSGFNTAAWGDYNNDGYQDVLVSLSNTTRLWTNGGDGSFTELVTAPFGDAYKSSSYWMDYNNDGYLDVMQVGYTSYPNYFCKIYRNNGDATFTEQSSTGLPGLVEGTAAWADFNKDGLPDVMLTGKNSSNNVVTKLYRNNGDNTFSEEAATTFTGLYQSAISWGDYDGDGDQDIVMMGYGYNPAYNAWSSMGGLWRNNGDGSFSEQSQISLPKMSYGSVAWGDYDSDGDLDLAYSGQSASSVYRNNGDNTFTNQTGIILPRADRSSVAWGDYDNDGRLDLLLCGTYTSNYFTELYHNDGDGSFSKSASASLPGIAYGQAVWGDYDNDSKLDILLSGGNEGTYHTMVYQSANPEVNTAPSAPANLLVSNSNTVSFSWSQSSDNQTSQNALTYNLYIGTTAGGGDILSPLANTNNGLRRVTTMGNTQLVNGYTISDLETGPYYWGVQAIDNGYASSAFSTGESFFYIGAPGVAATNLQFTNIQDNQLTLSWVNGNGTKRAVFAKQSFGGSPAPETDVNYSASSTFASGSQISSSGWYCVYNGTGSTTTVTNIARNLNYRFAVVEYNNIGDTYRYLNTPSPTNPRTRYRPISGSGLALSFDGTDDHISVPTTLGAALSEGTAITIEYWFKGSQLQSPVRIQDANGYLVAGWRTDNPVHIISTDGGTAGGVSVGSESIVEDGTWHHLAMTWEKNTANGFRSYLDGVLVASRASADVNLPVLTTTSTYLGCYNGTGEFLNGNLDEIRIWNVARTQTEICTNMCLCLTPGNESNLVAYYNFDTVAGTSLLVDSKNSHNGTLVNSDTSAVWTPSAVPMGDSGSALLTTIPTLIGGGGQSCLATITSIPNAANFLNLYTSAIGNGPITSPDVGSWPADVVQRSDIIWGVHAIGTVVANLVFDYGSVPDLSGDIHLLKRPDAGSGWIDVTDDFVHDAINQTFTKLNNASFSEYSVGREGGDESLPVTLSEFKANIHGQDVEIVWSTESEIENLGFILERKTERVILSSTEGENTGDDEWIQIASYETDSELESQGSVSTRSRYAYVDDSVIPGEVYEYRLADVSYAGDIVYHEMTLVGVSVENLPDSFVLHQNYPNPFNPSTTIRYELPKTSDVTITIYNLLGQEVFTFNEPAKTAGIYSLQWNGRDNCGQQLASGIYLISFTAFEFRAIQKVILNR